MFNRECRECGTAYVAQRAHSKFCCRQCNRDFNNRKATRGVELYDFVMNWRFGSGAGRDDEARNLLCTIVGGYREADKAERDGRRSWLTTREALDALERLPGAPDYDHVRRKARKGGDEPF